MNQTSGVITDIQRFSLYDGPGIRTTVFFKGCPLRCRWCHNPECISFSPQLRFLSTRCTGCGRCVAACPHGAQEIENGVHIVRRELCLVCGKCVRVCPVEALLTTGRTCTVQEIMKPVLADRRYYETSGGGMTLSGGEPLAQPAFACALLQSAKQEGIHTAIETSGYAPLEVLENMLELCDLFLFDYKATDPSCHKALTGVDNGPILANLKWLIEKKAQVILRCPIIPGENDGKEHLEGIAALLRRYPSLIGCELMAYHSLGKSKYGELGLSMRYDGEEMDGRRRHELLAFVAAHSPVRVSWG